MEVSGTSEEMVKKYQKMKRQNSSIPIKYFQPGNLPFEEKKAKFFNNERSFDSRNLLHTIASFAMSKWGPAQIEEASEKIIRILVNNYNIELDEQQ